MADCCNCQGLQKQLEELKRKHFLDFKAIKQKIISTDKLIGSYQEKCHEHDKQKRSVVELTTKLDGAQRSVAVIKLQLKKSLELKGPLQKKCDELEQEKLLQNAEIQKLQDGLKGSENLVAQLQSVIKQSEILTSSLRLDASLHAQEIDEYKKSQKKNEAQISKLEEQILTKKNANVTLNKELSKSQNRVKTLIDETEKSKMVIADLEKQLNSGKSQKMKSDENDYLRIIKELKEELLKFKQQNMDEDEDEHESQTIPRGSPRIRKSVAPNREESLGKIEERPLTRLQQKHLVKQIEKKTPGNELSHGGKLGSEMVEKDKDMMLMDRINELFGVPDCPCLSPLPPSPSFNHSTGECGNNDAIGEDIDYSGHEPECKGNENIDKCVNDEIIPRNEDEPMNETRELTPPEFRGKLMTLRSRKRRRKVNTSHDFGIFSRQSKLGASEASTARTLSRTQSEVIKKELNTSGVNVRVTRSRSLEESTGTEGFLIVKPRRRKKRRLSSNDGEETLESSDTSVAENNVVHESKQFKGDDAREDYVFNKTPSLDNSCEQDVVNDGTDLNDVNASSVQDFTTENQNSIETSCQEISKISKADNIVEDAESKEQGFVSKTHVTNTDHISCGVEPTTTRDAIFQKSDQSFMKVKVLAKKIKDTEDNSREINAPKRGRQSSNHSFVQDTESLNLAGVSTPEKNSIHPVEFDAIERSGMHPRQTDSSVNNENTTTWADNQNNNNCNTSTGTVNNSRVPLQDVVMDSMNVVEGDSNAISVSIGGGNDQIEDSNEQMECIEQCRNDKFSLGATEEIIPELRNEMSNESGSCRGMEENETSPGHEGSNILNESLHLIPPLSPMPVTPTKPCQPAEIPNYFHSLDRIFPLSPIPPSPPQINKAMEEDLAIDETVATSQNDAEKKKINTNELPKDSLHRYSGVVEAQYIVFIFTKLKNKEISLEQLITALSLRKNVKNHNPICHGLIRVLSETGDDVEQALLKKCADQYEFDSEAMCEPIVSQFEMDVLAAVNRLCKIQRLSSLLTKFIHCLSMNLCRLLQSERNDAGLLAMCRIHAGVCRLMGEGRIVLVFCYDLLKQNKRYPMTERILLAVALVWPYVLGKDFQPLIIHPEAVTISGPSYRPFLATLQVILMSRESSYKRWFQRLCDWCDISEDINVSEWLARDLVRVLRRAGDATNEDDSAATVDGLSFETFKCLELLALHMEWRWTNDVLIREILWPVFKEWNSENESMDSIIANILRLLGDLGGEKLQKRDTINMEAVVNLACAILTNPDWEKVSFSVQVAAANTLLELILADPLKITEVLEGWCSRKNKTDDKLVAKIAYRLNTHTRTKQ